MAKIMQAPSPASSFSLVDRALRVSPLLRRLDDSPTPIKLQAFRQWCPRHNHFYLSDTSLLNAAQQETSKQSRNTLSPSQDFLAGSASGIASTIVGHPFDTLKLRLQMTSAPSSQFSGALDCASQTLAKEGIPGLYRGLVSPLLTIPLVNAIVFSTYEQAKRFLLSRHAPDAPKLSTVEAMGAGAYAGLVNTIVVTPVELIKCRLQAQGSAMSSAVGNSVQYAGTIDCIRHLLRTHGITKLWQGQVATGLREVPSYVGMFGTYEILKQFFSLDGEQASSSATIISGGIAGCVCWAVSYPQDVVKSKLQLQDLSKPLEYQPFHRFVPDGGFINCSKHILHTEGFNGLWKGFAPCILRAFPACAAGFYAYELVREVFLKDKASINED